MRKWILKIRKITIMFNYVNFLRIFSWAVCADRVLDHVVIALFIMEDKKRNVLSACQSCCLSICLWNCENDSPWNTITAPFPLPAPNSWNQAVLEKGAGIPKHKENINNYIEFVKRAKSLFVRKVGVKRKPSNRFWEHCITGHEASHLCWQYALSVNSLTSV